MWWGIWGVRRSEQVGNCYFEGVWECMVYRRFFEEYRLGLKGMGWDTHLYHCYWYCTSGVCAVCCFHVDSSIRRE
jgi:hypothetical protein